MKKRNTPESDELRLQYYLVGFIDLLGQKDKLARMADLPMPEVLEGDVAELLRGTMGAVELFERSFQWYLGAGAGARTAPPSSLPSQNQALIERLLVRTVTTYRLSDAVVIQVPLSGDPITAVGNVTEALKCSATAVLTCLSAGHPSGGGLDVHWAGLMGGELYGPALYLAYNLEREAGSPRVLVGDGLRRYLATMCRVPGDSQESRFLRYEAGLCASLIGEDPVDGRTVLDYLGAGYRTQLGGPQAHRTVAQEILPSAYEFVLREERRLQADGKLGPRYSHLRRYLEARAPIWHAGAA